MDKSQDKYSLDPSCLLSKHNYRVEAKIEHGAQQQRNILCVPDLGVGPNLIRIDLLSPLTRSRIVRGLKAINLASSSKHRLNVIRILPFTVTIACQSTRTTLVAVKELGPDVIIGYQYKHGSG